METKSAILIWAETNETIFAKRRDLQDINATLKTTPWWMLWKRYILEEKYLKTLIEMYELSHANNQMLKASLL